MSRAIKYVESSENLTRLRSPETLCVLAARSQVALLTLPVTMLP